jgi:hypothetical protein
VRGNTLQIKPIRLADFQLKGGALFPVGFEPVPKEAL